MQQRDMTPKEIVAALDQYIVGQNNAKRCVAVALRNRYRRRMQTAEIQDEIIPKNIIMIGPTGVGKTEIARRLAKLVNAPFIKVEATKFTEVGYVGRDVESIIRDLVETSIRIVKEEQMEKVRPKAQAMAEERLLDILAPKGLARLRKANPMEMFFGQAREEQPQGDAIEQEEARSRREHMKKLLSMGEMEDHIVEIEVEESQNFGIVDAGMGEMGINLQEILGSMMPKKTKKRRLAVAEARKIIEQEEAQNLIDMDEVTSMAIERAEQSGIVFLDEIDKITGKSDGHGPDISREGVQRDILPIVEGSTVITKYGQVKTDYILFIAAGAFHVAKPSDLIPELQGRFPIRVELESLTEEDFRRILTEPQNSLLKQYVALLQADGVALAFADSGIEAMAAIACEVNDKTENIGARRLHTILEKVLEDLLYEAPNPELQNTVIDRKFVEEKLSTLASDEDISRFIL